MHSVAAVHYNATEARLQLDHLEQSYQQPRKRSVGFQGRPDDDQQAFYGDKEAVSMSSGIVHQAQSEVEPSNKIHSEKRRWLSQPHHKFGEDGKSYSMSETDPVLLMKAHAFVQRLLIKAAEEAHKRQNSETQALLYPPLCGSTQGKPDNEVNRRKRRPLLSFLHSEDESNETGTAEATNSERHIEFIRETIRKQCRRAYRLFLGCLGRMP